MISDGSLSFECIVFDPDQRYEVDKLEDLQGAERIARQIADLTAPLLPALFEPAGARA